MARTSPFMTTDQMKRMENDAWWREQLKMIDRKPVQSNPFFEPPAPEVPPSPRPSPTWPEPGTRPQLGPPGAFQKQVRNEQRVVEASPVNARTIIDGLVARGVPRAAAIGFAGNVKQESSFVPDKIGDNGNSYGLFQLNGTRKDALFRFAKDHGLNPADPQTQMDYVTQELNTTERRARDAIYAAQTPAEAARIISDTYFRPGDPRMENRLAYTAQAAGEQPNYAPLVGVLPGRTVDPASIPPEDQQMGTIEAMLRMAAAQGNAAQTPPQTPPKADPYANIDTSSSEAPEIPQIPTEGGAIRQRPVVLPRQEPQLSQHGNTFIQTGNLEALQNERQQNLPFLLMRRGARIRGKQ